MIVVIRVSDGNKMEAQILPIATLRCQEDCNVVPPLGRRGFGVIAPHPNSLPVGGDMGTWVRSN